MMRTGIGFDVHRFAAGRKLVLGGVRIRHPEGLDGHSDADVLCHAVADALLGAMALGDIGVHFPNTSPKWKGADSLKLLKKSADLVRKAGGSPVNVDSTVIAERPKIAKYVAGMRKNMAKAIGIDMARVSVKATTMETMGAIGRGEGIAVMAIAGVEQAKS